MFKSISAMKIITLVCLVLYLAVICQGAYLMDGGRNDGEPDYEPGFIEVRDAGRNDGEPDYDPGFAFEVRDGGRNDGEPDYDPMGMKVWTR